ncbi:NAD(P)H-dependent oxidoreductase [Colwellia psychrerythraea]|uniref:NADPH-dependent FMN reductase n=1 Tax=Colwellia psychrerythraea TaxID=28229 RepID=A0A099KG57_COLPS|nr:NAD(P)H-dependent oxidoreductase [Colwellia psychrerythraea]KGJ88987.1 NADPH-dependent FMN reductase [Colwellia psychrerythraea]
MNILLVSGSQRDNSKSFAVAQYLQTNILNDIQEIDSTILDLSRYPFLLDHYGIAKDDTVRKDSGKDDATALANNKDEVLSQLYACDAVVFIAPEWGGMIPPALVNLLLLTANGSANGLPLGHKPAFAVGVSASGGGSNPISLLKGYAAKNSHLTWLPLHAIIQNVDDFLTQDWAPQLHSRFSQVQSRLLVGLKSLTIYAKQLSSVREELVELSKVHPFGQ